MRFLTALESQISVNAIAGDFLRKLNDQCAEAKDGLSYTFAADFINECLLAIGLQCQFTADHIENRSTKDYPWPLPQMRIYTFRYNHLKFHRFELFLFKVASDIAKQQQNNIKMIQQQQMIEEVDETTTDEEERCLICFLLECATRTLALWCNAFHYLKNCDSIGSTWHFEEPLARINFHLLLGLHKIRASDLDFPLLSNVWSRLLWSAQDGLHYVQSHDLVLNGFMEIITGNFNFLQDYLPQMLSVINVGLTLDHTIESKLKCYKCLQYILNNVYQEFSEEQQEIVRDYLINEYMLNIYYMFLDKSRNSGKHTEHQMEILKFLISLIKILPNLDCFSSDFLGIVLMLTSKDHSGLRELAANLYIAMITIKLPNTLDIVKLTLEYYATQTDSFDLRRLRLMISVICTYFPDFGKFKNSIKIMCDEDTVEHIKVLSSWIIFTLFDMRKQLLNGKLNTDMLKLMKFLPELFKHLNCQRKIDILMQIFETTSIEQWTNLVQDNYMRYVEFVILDHENRFGYPLLMNLLSIYEKCLEFTEGRGGEENFQHLIEEVYGNFLEEMRRISDLIENSKRMNELLEIDEINYLKCFCLTMRINILIKMNRSKEFINLEPTDMDRLMKIIFETEKHLNIPWKSFNTWKVQIMEIINSSLIHLMGSEITDDDDVIAFSRIADIAKNLLDYIWQKLWKLDKYSIVALKTYIYIISCLHCNLFQMDQNHYDRLLKILIQVNFLPINSANNLDLDRTVTLMAKKLAKDPIINGNNVHLPELNPKRLDLYQRFILRRFTLIHNEKINSHVIDLSVIWKLCIFYGLKSHNFNEELKNLLVMLQKYSFPLFKQIIGLVLYNLHGNCQPKLKQTDIINITRAYKSLLDKDIVCESPPILCIEITLNVMEIVSTNMLATDETNSNRTGVNRLASLTHLNILFENIYNENNNIVEIILKESERFQIPGLNSTERNTLRQFRAKVETMRINNNNNNNQNRSTRRNPRRTTRTNN